MSVTLLEAYRGIMRDGGGVEVFEDPKRAKSMMADLVGDEPEVMRDFDQFYTAKGIETLRGAVGEPAEEQLAKLNQVRNKIRTMYGTDLSYITASCNAFAEAIGLKARLEGPGRTPPAGNAQPSLREKNRKPAVQEAASPNRNTWEVQQSAPGAWIPSGMTFRETEGGLELSSYQGTESIVRIPDTANGKKVVSIASKAFTGGSVQMTLTEVRIPASVRRIGECAFKGCRKLSRVEFANRTEELLIGKSAFEESGIQEMDLPGSVREVPEACFLACGNLRTVRFPGVETIGKSAMENCYSLASAVFSGTLHQVGESAFSCSSIENLDFLSASDIGERCFQGCMNLKRVSMTGSGREVRLGARAFAGCMMLQEVSLSETVCEVGDECFADCETLTRLHGKGIRKAGYRAFADCPSLETPEMSKEAYAKAKSRLLFEGSPRVETRLKPSLVHRVFARRKVIKI